MGEFAKFILAGVINTLVGYSTFWVGIHAFGLSPFLSNASGYAVALAIAYLLNRHFVFSSHRAIPTGGGSRDAGSIIRFLFAFVFAFALNQLTLWGAIGI
jgi:putative flippase GtrA